MGFTVKGAADVTCAALVTRRECFVETVVARVVLTTTPRVEGC